MERMAEWKNGRAEEWQIEGMAEWKNDRGEGIAEGKNGRGKNENESVMK